MTFKSQILNGHQLKGQKAEFSVGVLRYGALINAVTITSAPTSIEMTL